jgi:hypothetical protein
MNRSESPFYRRLSLLTLVMIVIGITYVLARLISTRATFHERKEQRTADFTVEVDEHGIPFTSYAAVDPALIPALESLNGFEPPDPLRVVVEGVPPIGIYLPSTGDTQFKLPPPTPTFAVPPLPTMTPLPSPPPEIAQGIITRTPVPYIPRPTLPPGVAQGNPAVNAAPPTLVPVAAGESCAPSGWPVSGRLTQYFHWYHPAIDLAVDPNTGVVATHGGQIIFAGWRTDGYGNLIILQSGIFITYYAHLNNFNVATGQVVGRGSVIGWSGSTGNSTGPHVHYEIRINDVPVDPLTFEQRGYSTC